MKHVLLACTAVVTQALLSACAANPPKELLSARAAYDEARASAASTVTPADVAEARSIPEPDASADAVVLLGPLYHLTEQAQRDQALREAWRVLKPGGVVAAVGISRFTALLDGLWQGWLGDPIFRGIAERGLADGQHRNPDPVRLSPVVHHGLFPSSRRPHRRGPSRRIRRGVVARSRRAGLADAGTLVGP